MKTVITLLIAILPIYSICLYIYSKDNYKESNHILKKLFILGMISCIPAAIVEYNLQTLFDSKENMNLIVLFIYISSSVALVEELFKWLFLYSITFNNREFDELYDAIVYAVFISLGFACFENIFYVLDGGILVGLLRGITAIPGHAADAIIMGNFYGLAKKYAINNNYKLMYKNIILSIIIPTITHAIYDYCLLSKNSLFVGLFIIFIIILYFNCFKKINKVSTKNKHFKKKKIL